MSGLPIIKISLDDIESEDSQSMLFSSAMKGIISLLSELTGKQDVPEEFGYVNFKIVMQESKNLISYLVCLNIINPVKTVLEEILNKMEQDLDETGSLSSDLIPEYSRFIKDRLYFTW
jgi:hypothetical protein